MTNAIVYARYSPRPDAEECASIDVQLDRCRAYARAHGYEVAAEYADPELSGGRADNRPGLQDAIDHACRAKAVLCVYKFERLARNTRDAIDISDRLQAAGADLASVTEGINTRGPMGRAFYQIAAVFAELERNQIRDRTSTAMRYHQANGRRMTRLDRCPYGKMPDRNGPMMERVDKKTGEKVLRPARLIDNPAELAIIERIWQERQAGRGLLEIARGLDQAGIDCRGRRWSHSIVRSILRRAGQVAETI